MAGTMGQTTRRRIESISGGGGGGQARARPNSAGVKSAWDQAGAGTSAFGRSVKATKVSGVRQVLIRDCFLQFLGVYLRRFTRPSHDALQALGSSYPISIPADGMSRALRGALFVWTAVREHFRV